MPKTRQTYVKTDNHDYFKVWSPSMAYILGFYTADGCITKNGNKLVFVFRINVKDIQILEFIRDQINPNRKITLWTTVQKSGHKSYMCILKITNQTICNDILNMGFMMRKTYNMHLPEIPEQYKRDFLRGYFDGDGSVQSKVKSKRVRIACIDNLFLQKVQECTVKCGKVVQTHVNKNTVGYDLLFSKNEDIKTFRDYIYYEGMPFFLERKYKKFQEMEFREYIQIAAFNEIKTLEEWVLDPRCYTTKEDTLYSRFKRCKNVVSNEAIITTPKSVFLLRKGEKR